MPLLQSCATVAMIRSFAHKGLANFFHNGATSGIQVKHADKLRIILALLDHAKLVDDIALPGMGLHPLKGQMKGHWSVKVSGNWRVTFRFEDGDAHIVNYQDYH